MPPPINAKADRRASKRARAGWRNQDRPRPAATAQAQSLDAASNTDTEHMIASCPPAGSEGSTNCGRNAVKNAMVLGFVIATRTPRVKLTPLGGGAALVLPALR